jgi:hypothetical protein
MTCGYICDPKSANHMSEQDMANKKKHAKNDEGVDNRPIGNKAAKMMQKTMMKTATPKIRLCVCPQQVILKRILKSY